MKRYCKNIKLDADWIKLSMLECLSDKWDRLDVAGFLAEYQEAQEPLPKRAAHKMIQADKTWA